MSFIYKRVASKILRFVCVFSFLAISIPAFSDDTTYYVRTNSNPYASPFFIFSLEPNGDSVELSLEKGYSYTFIRTDDFHAFNIGDDHKVLNTEIEYSSNGTGGIVGGVSSILNGEQLTISIPENFSGDSLSYFCYPHSSMIATFDVTDSVSPPTTQLTSWDFDGNGEADALTDGLLLLRYMFALRGDDLTNGAVASNSPMTMQQVQDVMASISGIADLDGNGDIDALTDGLLLIRYLFGLSGGDLISGSISSNATRSTSDQIVQYIESLMPESLSDQASGLLVPMADSQEFTALFSQSYQRTFETTSDAIVLESTPDMATDAAVSDAGGDSYTSTYTLEKSVDEHDFVKYHGSSNKLFIAPSYSLNDDCCFLFEPISTDDILTISANASKPEAPTNQQRSIKILSTNPELAEVTHIGSIPIDNSRTIEGLYTFSDQIASINSTGWPGMYGQRFENISEWENEKTGLSIYDISGPAVVTDTADTSNIVIHEPVWEFEIDGGFVTSRKIDDIIYLVARHTPEVAGYIEYSTIEQREQNDEILNTVSSSDILPKISINDAEKTDFLIVSDCFAFNDDYALAPNTYGYPTMTVLLAVDVTNQLIVNSTCYLESTSGVYVSQNAIYLIQQEGWGDNSTSYIHKFNLDSDLSYSGSGKVEGHVTGRGQADFRISEYGGYVRVVTSEFTGDVKDSRDHRLTILKQSPNSYSLNQVATLPNSAYPAEIGKPDEALYGVRFFGDKLYLVTFETTDPLYVIDLRNHFIPRVAGELEIPGFSDFLHPVNDELLLGLGQNGTGNVKLELFNIPPLPSADEPVASIEPFSLKEFQVGADLINSWSHSPAQFNRNAFQYQQIDDSTDRFSVPLTISYNSDTSGYVQENQLYLFELQNKDQPEQASFDFVRSISGGSSGWWNNDRQRSFFHNDSVFYINGDDVYSEFWDYPEIQLP